MIIISWNVNSISKRLPLVLDIIKEEALHVLFLQEIRSEVTRDMIEILEVKGYQVFFNPHQKGRNGVMTLIRKDIPAFDVKRDIFEDERERGRILENMVFWKGKRIILTNVYIHQGASYANKQSCSNVKSKNFLPERAYLAKLVFLRKLAIISKSFGSVQNLFRIIGGDFNVVYRKSDSWHFFENSVNQTLNTVSFTQEERSIMSEILSNLDEWSYRLNNNPYDFTWYDYRNYTLNLKRGMKVDYCLCSKDIECLRYSRLIKFRQSQTVTSDHVPILYEFNF